MSATPAAHLAKARVILAGARQILGLSLTAVAAREAYLGAFHAALALILHSTGHEPRTHRGVRSEFGRLARGHPRLGRDMTAFLALVYDYKSDADYDVTDAPPLPAERAADAIARAETLLDIVAELVAAP